jgi:ubiquinone/menaquinone biosynthesis C-methylase UbiE
VFYKGGKMVAGSPNTDLHGYGEQIRQEVGSRVPRDKKLKVLDVGTGFGINVAFLARWLSKGSEVWTVDPSKEVLANVKAMLAAQGLHMVNFAEASADDLDFADGSFDVVVSVMVLHHLEKLQPALKEMARVLSPDGVLVIVDYKPEASHELEFATRHEKKDFFRPSAVATALGTLGMKAVPNDHGLWYLVEAKKPRAGPARPSGRGRATTRSAK